MDVSRIATLVMEPPAELQLTLPSYYYSGVFVILVSGLLSLAHSTSVFVENYHRLPSVVKSYGLLLIWDWYLVVNYLVRDAYTVNLGYLDTGLWCRGLGFANIAGVLALRLCAAATAYAVYRLAVGSPVSDRSLTLSYTASWVTGTLLAGLFLVNDAYGPYKGLYCCIKETKYQPYATVPCFLVTFSSMSAVVYYFFKAQRHMEAQGDTTPRSTRLIVWRSAVHGLAFYLVWSLIIAAGTVTALGGHVPVLLDVLAAWLCKLEPSVDSFLLLDTMEMLLEEKDGKGMQKKRQ